MLPCIVYKYPDVLEYSLNLIWKPKAIRVYFVSVLPSLQYLLIIVYNLEKKKETKIKKYEGKKKKVYLTLTAKEQVCIYYFPYTFS